MPKDVTFGNTAHTRFPDSLKNVVIRGDCLSILQSIPDSSFHLTFTSPPYYNAKSYSKYETYNDYLKFLTAVFSDLHRATKAGRFLVVNTSPVIVERKNRAHESRRFGIPFDLHVRLTKMGWDFIDDIIWRKPDPSVPNRNGGFFQHRKPLGYKPNVVTEYVMVYRKRTDRLIDWSIDQYDTPTTRQSLVTGAYDKTNVWSIAPESSKDHPAIFPKELCRRVIRYYSYVGDLICDPFAGIGTTGIVASSMGRFFFLLERNERYYNVTRSNLEDTEDVRFI